MATMYVCDVLIVHVISEDAHMHTFRCGKHKVISAARFTHSQLVKRRAQS